MITILYLKLLGSASLGQLLQILMKADSLSKTAATNNIQYNFKWFLSLDWKPIMKAFVGIAFFFIVFGQIANPNHLANQNAPYTIIGIFTIPLYLIWNTVWLILAFVFGGFGSYIAFKVQSEATKRIFGAIDSKTTVADITNKTTDQPTPATKL